MALTLSPYATGFSSDSLNAQPAPSSSPLRATHGMSRAVSVNMDNLAGGDESPKNQQQLDYVEHLVANFADPMGMQFTGGAGEEHRGARMADPNMPHGPDVGSSSSMHPPPATGGPSQHGQHAQHQPHPMDDMFHNETGLDGGSDEDDEEDDSPAPNASGTAGKRRRETLDVPGGFTKEESGRRKIKIEYIQDKARRHVCFSKRKAGIMKKAYELSILTGTQCLLLVVSETGLVYTFTTTKLQPMVTKAEGKNLIQACLNAPDGMGPDGQPVNTTPGGHRIRSGPLTIRPHKLTAATTKAMLSTAAQVAGATPDEAEAQASAQAHANAQAKAAAALGNGSPVSRPKKRLPSGKKLRTASSHSLGGASSSDMRDMHQPPEMIPPVPSIPDMHRQASPSTHLMPHGQPPTPNPLQSPLTAGYHIPPEYQQHPPPHPHGVPSPTYGYPPQTPTSATGEYVPHPGMPGYGYQTSPAQAHPNFMVHPATMYPHAQPPPTEPRRMMPPDGSNTMRMGM